MTETVLGTIIAANCGLAGTFLLACEYVRWRRRTREARQRTSDLITFGQMTDGIRDEVLDPFERMAVKITCHECGNVDEIPLLDYDAPSIEHAYVLTCEHCGAKSLLPGAAFHATLDRVMRQYHSRPIHRVEGDITYDD